MEWFKKQVGLKIWCAVWLLVLLIPLWREDAREQWSGQNWSESFGSSPRALTTEKVEAIAARVPDDVAAQLELINAHRSGYYSQDKIVVATNFDQYAQLSGRFPRENAVRQAWLLDITMGSLRIESDATYNATFPAKIGQFRPKRENWLGKPQLEAGVQAARDGAKIEPLNSFFPWLEATLCFALQRPDNAMDALQRASKCSYFDDGIQQTARRRIALLGRVQSVGWSDKSRAMWGVLLPHLARIRATARAALEVSSQAQKRGDKVGALQIAATVARAGATISEYKGSLLTAAVGDAVQGLAWSGALKNAGRELKVPVFPGDEGSFFGRKEFLPAREAFGRKTAQQVAIYARESKQEAIARQVLASLPASKSSRLAAVLGDSHFDGAWQKLSVLGEFGWLETRLLWFSLSGAGVWLVTRLLSLRQQLSPQAKRATASLGAFCVGATAVLLGVGVFYFGLGSVETFFLDNSFKVSDLGVEFHKKLNIIVALLWILPVVLNAITSALEVPGGRERRDAGAIRGVQIAIYSAIAASLAGIWVVSGVERPAFSPFQNDAIVALISSLLAALAFHVALAKKDTSRLAALLFWLVPLIVLGTSFDFDKFAHSMWVIPTLALIGLMLVLCLRLTKWPPTFLRLETRATSAVLLLQTLLYAAILGSITAIFVIYNSTDSPLFNENINRLLSFSLLAIVVVGGFHITKAKGKARVAALLFWSVPLIFVTTRTMLHPEIERNLVVAWRFMALIFLLCSARMTGWQPDLAVQRFGFDLIGRVRILAATLVVASAVSYLGVKVAALPSEARMSALIDAQLKDGEVTWLEKQLR